MSRFADLRRIKSASTGRRRTQERQEAALDQSKSVRIGGARAIDQAARSGGGRVSPV